MTKMNYIIVSIILVIMGALTAFTWSLQQAYFGPTWLFIFKHIFVFVLVVVPINVLTQKKYRSI